MPTVLSTPGFSLVELLRRRAAESPGRTAFTFLDAGGAEAEALTWAGLDARARAVAAALQEAGGVGERALLLHPPGLGFVESFLGCLYAGVVAVPAYPPGRNRAPARLRSIAADAGARVVLAPAAIISRSRELTEKVPELGDARWISTDELDPGLAGDWRETAPASGDPAFLQYTSGSTSDPKGVVVTHGNLLHNEEAIRGAFGMSESSVVVGWLPLYHDMGLIGSVLQPLYADLDPASLSAYRQLFRLSSPNHAFLAEDDFGLLRKLGVWKRDRETGEEGPTLAAVLMLGREEAIREHLPHVHLDYREFPAEDEGGAAAVRWLDRVTLDGTWSGNVLGFYQRVLPKLVAGLKVPFHLEPDLLRRDETHVHEALREALVNSLVHADYSAATGIRVFRKPDGYEFLNPGTLLLPIEQIRAGGTSECRNPLLQHMFRLAGLGEKAGSGFPTILRAWREQHWRAPLLEDDVDRYETRLRLGVTSLFPEATLEALRARFGDRFRRLTEDARLALATAWTEGRVTNGRLRELRAAMHGISLCFSARWSKEAFSSLTRREEPGGTPFPNSRAPYKVPQKAPCKPDKAPSKAPYKGPCKPGGGPSKAPYKVRWPWKAICRPGSPGRGGRAGRT